LFVFAKRIMKSYGNACTRKSISKRKCPKTSTAPHSQGKQPPPHRCANEPESGPEKKPMNAAHAAGGARGKKIRTRNRAKKNDGAHQARIPMSWVDRLFRKIASLDCTNPSPHKAPLPAQSCGSSLQLNRPLTSCAQASCHRGWAASLSGAAGGSPSRR